MKENRRFWFIFVASAVAVVGGYVILMNLNPDKTHEGQYLPAAICLLVIPVGGVTLLGTLLYAVLKTAANRRHLPRQLSLQSKQTGLRMSQ